MARLAERYYCYECKAVTEHEDDQCVECENLADISGALKLIAAVCVAIVAGITIACVAWWTR